LRFGRARHHAARVTPREDAACAVAGPSRAAAASAAVAIGLLLVRDALLLPELRVLGDLALGLALVVLARERGLRLPSQALLLVAGLAWIASHVMALDADASLEALAHEARMLAAFSVGATLVAGSVAAQRAVAFAAAACGAGLAAHGWAQVAWIHPRLLLELPSRAGQLADSRANSVLLLPGHLAALLAAAVALGAGHAIARRGWARAGTMLLVLVAASGLVAARSFSGLLLAAVGLSVVVLPSLTPGPRRWTLGATALATLVLVIASARLRAGELTRENPALARARNWRTAASLVREAPLAGHGGGSFAVEHARVRPRASNDVRHAHQAFLEAAEEHGLIALPLLVAGMTAVLLAGLRASRAADASASVAAGCLGASVVVIGHGLLDFGWSVDSFGGPAAFLLGSTWALVDRPRARPKAMIVLGLVMALATLVTLGDGLAEGLSELALLAAGEGDHAGARELLARARHADPLDDSWAAEGASAALALALGSPDGAAGMLVEAESLARRAVALSPRKAANHELLARILAAGGRRVEASAAAIRASQLAPQRHDLAELRDRLLAELAPAGPGPTK
jgi:O-antigen ligase